MATSHTELLDQKLWERSSAICITVKLPGGAGECWRTAALEWLFTTSSAQQPLRPSLAVTEEEILLEDP